MSKPNITDAMANIVDIYETVVDATAGYRAKLEAAGFSPTAAESMAEDFHRHLLDMTMKPSWA